MDDMDDSICVSVANSDDVVWESLKVDLELNRAHQEEQLQTLKGKLLRVPPSKAKVQKPLKKRKSPLKKLLKKKAFWKALDIIKSLTSKVKGKRRCHSTVNFTVCCNPPDSDTENNNSEDSTHIDKLHQENGMNSDFHRNVRDQVVQTEQLVVEDKLCQTNLPQNAATRATANIGDIVSPQIPLYVAPVCYGVCMHSIAGSTCCGNSKTPMCSVSTHKTGQCQHANHVQTDDNHTSSQFSLKQICEQLLVQLSEKINGRHSDSQDKDGRASENSTKIPDVSSVQTREIVDALLNLHPGMKVLTVNHMATSDASSTRTSSTFCQSSETQSVKAAAFPEVTSKPTTAQEMLPLSVNSPQTVASVTPDLLRNNSCPISNTDDVSADMFNNLSSNDSCSQMDMIKGHCSQKSKQTSQTTRSTHVDKQVDASDVQNQPDHNKDMDMIKMKSAAQCSQGDKPKGSLFKIGQPHANRQTASDMVFSEKTKNPSVKNITSSTTQAGSLSTRASERVLSNVAKISAAANVINSSSMAPEMLEVSQTPARNDTDDSCSKVSKILFLESGDSNDSSLIDVVTPVVTKPSTKDDVSMTSPINSTRKVLNNLNINSNSAFKPLIQSATSESNKSVSTSAGEHCKSQSIEANLKGGKDATDKELKVLSRVQNPDLINVSRKKAVNSPAFDEMDAAELESLLVVWRQQELLHRDTVSEKNSSGVFKKIKRPRELPAELRSEKVIQPLQLSAPLKNSILDMLDWEDKEAKKPVEEDEDDDVSENSPKSIVQPSKKRKLSLKPNAPSALRLVFEKSKEPIKESLDSSEPTEIISEQATTAALLQPEEGKTDDQTPDAKCSGSESDLPIALRLSRRVKGSKKNSNSKPVEKETELKVKGRKNLPKKPPGNKETNETKSKKADGCPTDIEEITKNKESPSNSNSSDTSKEYIDQIKERNNKLKKQWLSGRSGDDDVFIRPLPRFSPPASEATDLDQGIMVSLEKIRELKDVSAIDIGKAHDLVVKIILNPWRGINAKAVTRGFVCPDYDSKSVSRALWDLRSYSIPEKVVESIVSLGWKDVHPHGFRALLSLFTLALTREVSFVIEANVGEDDTVSLYSDAENTLDKKPTPLRLVATKQIFKGECIEGLNGLLLKVPTQDKDKLRSWIFPKFEQQRDWAMFGPLAYLRRKESCANTMAVSLRGEVIAVKATRHILCGERLYVSVKELEKTLFS